ncbi:hypothetical protein CsatA_025190 [Cannabis sativa]
MGLSLYAIQTTKLSNRIVTKIDGLVRNFWWDFEKGNHGLHLKAWDKLCPPKSLGGLGFQKTRKMNQAFLGKWGWNILNGSQSLCCQILAAKYLKGKHFLNCSYKDSDSWFWKNIVKAKSILRKGAYKLVAETYLSQDVDRAPQCEVAPLFWNKLWNSKILEHHKILWWCILSSALPTWVVIRSSPWGIYHVCDTGIRMWDWIKFIWDLKHRGIPAYEVFFYALIIVDTIWRICNDKVHNHSSVDVKKCIDSICTSFVDLHASIFPSPTSCLKEDWHPLH